MIVLVRQEWQERSLIKETALEEHRHNSYEKRPLPTIMKHGKRKDIQVRRRRFCSSYTFTAIGRGTEYVSIPRAREQSEKVSFVTQFSSYSLVGSCGLTILVEHRNVVIVGHCGDSHVCLEGVSCMNYLF